MKTKLETFLQEINEKTTVNNQYPILTASKSGLHLQKNYFNKQVASKDNTGYKVIRRGQFTYRSMSDTGEFYPNILDCTDIGIVSPAYPVFEISNREIIIPEFLKYFFKSEQFQYSISKFAQGSTRTSIKFTKMKTVSINVPSLEIQQEIVSRLDKVSDLIEKRRQQLDTLDQLVKSRFIEMFGADDYPEIPFDNMCVFLRNGANIKQAKGAGGYPITRIETLSNDIFNIDRLGYADITDLEKYQSYVLHEGDILISHINSVTYLGRAVQYRGQLDTPIIHGMNLLCARIVDSYNPTYIECFFKTPMAKEYISTITKKAVNQASITTSDLKKMKVPNPPKILQDQFAAFVEQTGKSKLAVRKSLDELETLKKALMQEYFG